MTQKHICPLKNHGQWDAWDESECPKCIMQLIHEANGLVHAVIFGDPRADFDLRDACVEYLKKHNIYDMTSTAMAQADRRGTL